MPWRQQDRLPHGVQISVGFTLQRLLVSLAFTSLFANVLFVLMPEKQDRCEAKLAQARSALSAAKADVESLRSELSSAKRRPCAHARGAEEVEQEDKGEASIEKASDGAHVGTRERGAVSSPATTGDGDEDAPRSYSFAAVGQSASEVLLPGQGIECAKEEQACECGGGLVWYGHALSHRWAQARAVDVSIKCSNAEFGDPAPHEAKACVCSVRRSTSSFTRSFELGDGERKTGRAATEAGVRLLRL